MPYRGRGDYRVVARGGIFSTIGHVIGGAVKGTLTGGPLGGIKGAIGGAVAATKQNIQESHADPVGSSSAATPAAGRDVVHVAHEQAAILKAAKSGKITAPTASALAKASVGKAAVLPSGQVMHIGGGHRRIRWTNVKALGRAERRIKMAVDHMTKYIKWVHPKKAGHAAPKFGKKRK